MQASSLELLDSLLVDVINRCRTIQSHSALLSHSEFASENPGKLAKLIGEMCRQLAAHLVLLRNKYNDDPANVVNDVRIIDDFVRDLGAHLRYVDGAIATKLPWSLPQPLERLTERLLPGTNLMLRPQWKYNYAILASDLGELYQDELTKVLPKGTVDEMFRDFPKNFHVISFPSVERRTALLHCDLGHEIGHLVAKRFLKKEAETSPYLIDLRERIATRIEEEVKQQTLPPLLVREMIQERLERAATVRWLGLAEIISDLFAMRLFGPASLFALFHMAIGDSLDLAPSEETSYYPPWRTRLRHSLIALETAKLVPIVEVEGEDRFPGVDKVKRRVKKRVEDIRLLTSQESDRTAIGRDWVVKVAYDSIDNAIPSVESFLELEYGGSFITPAKLYGQVYNLVHRLYEKIPPNAVETMPYGSQPADLEAILTAAWFYRISFLDEPFPNGQLDETFQREYRILNRLTLKAVEYSHIQWLYNAWDVELGEKD